MKEYERQKKKVEEEISSVTASAKAAQVSFWKKNQRAGRAAKFSTGHTSGLNMANESQVRGNLGKILVSFRVVWHVIVVMRQSEAIVNWSTEV